MLKTFLAVLLLVSANSHATTNNFFEWKKHKGGASEKRMRSLYDPIPYNSGNKQQARLAILKAMQSTKGTAWLVEAEGDGYILARWDYKGHAIIHRIEYDDKYVQIKYAGGVNAYECEMLVGDYCYKTHRNYYKYNVSLVKNIRQMLNKL